MTPRTLVVVLAALVGFAVPAGVLLHGDADSLGALVARVFGGAALCIATTVTAATLAWIVCFPGTRRRRARVLGALLGFGGGLGIVAGLAFADGDLDARIVGGLLAPPCAIVVGLLVGWRIARGADARAFVAPEAASTARVE